MRVLVPLLMLAVAGCATSPEGHSTKNTDAARYERLGVVTDTPPPEELSCSRRQVMWCAEGNHGRQCKCVFVHQAKDRVRRMADQIRHSPIGD